MPTLISGEDLPQAKLTEKQVLQIRKDYNLKGIKQIALAKRFGVRQDQISRIVNGLRWRHVWQ